jgi:hypothetical protein
MATTPTTPTSAQLPISDPIGSIPPDNQPGHHPEVEQDKPTRRPRLKPKLHAAAAADGFPFAFDPLFLVPAAAAGVTPWTARVTVDATFLRVRFGPWSMTVELENVAGTEVTGPYRPWKVIGPPHLSLADGGITFGTNASRGLCIALREPVPGIEPTGRLRHPGLTVTVADPEALAERLSI